MRTGNVRKMAGVLLPASFLVLSSSCGMIYEDIPECKNSYEIGFIFDRNILNTDAFGPQVSTVDVSLYEPSGRLVWNTRRERDKTSDNTYRIVADVPPGKYDIIAWCEGKSMIEDAVSFNLAGRGEDSSLQDSQAFLDLDEESGNLSHSHDIHPFFWGKVGGVVLPEPTRATHTISVPLTKDTNHITVILQNINGKEINPSLLGFELEGFNSRLSSENLPDGKSFVYHPWSVEGVWASFDEVEEDKSSVEEKGLYNGVEAEFTTSRIMADKEQRLIVKKKGEEAPILSIPLVKYLLLVRNKYEQAYTNQDYLDCCDEYKLLFFIDENYTWIKSRIYINNWRVVPPQSDTL